MPSPEVVEEALEKWILNLGCSRPIFILLNTIRFFFPLAFPTRLFQPVLLQKLAKLYAEKNASSRKQWLSFSSCFGFAQTYYAISRAVVGQFLFYLISLDSSFD